jgi:small subunit ribosomal protein S9
MSEDKTQGQEPEEQQEPTAEAPAEETPAQEQPAADSAPPAEESPAQEQPAADAAPPAEESPAEEQPAADAAPPAEESPAQEQPAADAAAPAEQPTAAAAAGEDLEQDVEDDEAPTPRQKPLIPGADLEVDIVREGEEALRGENLYGEYDEDAAADASDREEDLSQPIADASIDLAAGARYTATGKRKTAVARVILKPGDGTYAINGKPLDDFFPRHTLQRTIRQPLETVGYETRMDVVASMHGGGVSAQADALRHGISRALIDADPNLRSELKRRGFLTRDARVKERKKAGLKKARKRPQFSKR